jgi:TolB-like protein
VDNLTRGTSFGRLVTEQLMTELNGVGFRVIEARKTTDYFLADRVGEFSLSRDLSKVAAQFSTDAVLVGTYSRSAEQILVNVRLVDVKDSSTIAAASAMMDIRGDAFLESVVAGEDGNIKRPNPLASVELRKKVIPETDHYSDTLQSMVKSMAGRISETAVDEGGIKTIAVTTFVDVNHLYRASTFGRYVGEQLLTELSQRGFNVVEMRASPDIVVDLRLGEIGLTREAERLVPKGRADAVVVGTYTKAGDTALVNGRMILAKTGKVVGVGDLSLDASPRNKFMAALFEQEITTAMPAETVEGY